MGKTCVICGKTGWSYYPFCREHLQMKADGKIVKCGECGTWHTSDVLCPNCKPIQETVTSKSTSESELTCIICGEPSNGKHFCRSCYYKHKDGSIDIRIIHCSETQIIDNYGNRTKKADNGLYVRSLQEKIIADELYRRNIRFAYEQTVVCKDTDGKIVELHPDFILPDYNLVIEHWGYQDSGNPDYIKTRKYKEPLYIQRGYKLAGTTSKDLDDIHATIDRILLENS